MTTIARAVVTLHRWSLAPQIEASDSIVMLLTENLSELHPRWSSNPRVATVTFPMPTRTPAARIIKHLHARPDPT